MLPQTISLGEPFWVIGVNFPLRKMRLTTTFQPPHRLNRRPPLNLFHPSYQPSRFFFFLFFDKLGGSCPLPRQSFFPSLVSCLPPLEISKTNTPRQCTDMFALSRATPTFPPMLAYISRLPEPSGDSVAAAPLFLLLLFDLPIFSTSWFVVVLLAQLSLILSFEPKLMIPAPITNSSFLLKLPLPLSCPPMVPLMMILEWSLGAIRFYVFFLFGFFFAFLGGVFFFWREKIISFPQRLGLVLLLHRNSRLPRPSQKRPFFGFLLLSSNIIIG